MISGKDKEEITASVGGSLQLRQLGDIRRNAASHSSATWRLISCPVCVPSKI